MLYVCNKPNYTEFGQFREQISSKFPRKYYSSHEFIFALVSFVFRVILFAAFVEIQTHSVVYASKRCLPFILMEVASPFIIELIEIENKIGDQWSVYACAMCDVHNPNG